MIKQSTYIDFVPSIFLTKPIQQVNNITIMHPFDASDFSEAESKVVTISRLIDWIPLNL